MRWIGHHFRDEIRNEVPRIDLSARKRCVDGNIDPLDDQLFRQAWECIKATVRAPQANSAKIELVHSASDPDADRDPPSYSMEAREKQ